MSEATAVGLPVPDHGVSEPSSATVAECHRVGRKWRLVLLNRSVLVEDSIGMVHLAVLIANRRQEIQAANLVAGLAGLSGAIADVGSAHPVLDHEAIAGYRNRLKRLDAEIGELEPGDDPARASLLGGGPGRTRLAGRPALQRRGIRGADAILPRPARARPRRGG